VYEHGTFRLVHLDPNVPRGWNNGLPAWWIDGAALHPSLRGQQFYYDAEDEPPAKEPDVLKPERDRAYARRKRQGKQR
jgi:hypothetical protein